MTRNMAKMAPKMTMVTTMVTITTPRRRLETIQQLQMVIKILKAMLMLRRELITMEKITTVRITMDNSLNKQSKRRSRTATMLTMPMKKLPQLLPKRKKAPRKEAKRRTKK